MAYDIDAAKMVQVLRIGREKLSDKGQTSAQKRVDPLRSQTGLPRAAVIDRMIETFDDLYGLNRDELKPEELEAARNLAETKFSRKEWIYIIP
jgi:lipoate-protein ligase A